MKNRIKFLITPTILCIIFFLSIATSQEKKSLEARVSELEVKIKELEMRISKIENQTTTKTTLLGIETSSPQKAAKAFWETVQRNDLETAKKYLISRDEASVIGPEISRQVSAKRKGELEKIEKLATMVKGLTWDRYEIQEQDYYQGHKGIGLNIHFKPNDKIKELGLYFYEVTDGYWKLVEIY